MNTDTITEIAIAELSESPFNPRKTFHDAALQSLTDDIISQGRVLQPLLVRPIVPPLFRDGHGDSTDLNAVAGYEIVFGHRRYRAASMAGLTHVPCMVRPMLDDEARRAQISENLARSDVHPIEEAEGFQALIDNDQQDADSIAELFGKSRSYVYGRLKLLEAVPEIRRACLAGEIGSDVTLLIARLRTARLQQKALCFIRGKGTSLSDGGERSVRAIRVLLKEKFMLDLKKVIFDITDEMLVPNAGNCMRCTKRSINAPEFSDVLEAKKIDNWSNEHIGAYVCTDPDCCAEKKTAHLKREAGKLVAEGKTVVDGRAAHIAINAQGKIGGAYIALSDVKTELKTVNGQRPTTVTIQDPRTGRLVQAVRVADLKAAGVKVTEAPKADDWAARQRRYDAEIAAFAAQADAENKVFAAVFEQVRAKARAQDPMCEFCLRQIAHAAFAGIVNMDRDVIADLYELANDAEVDEAIKRMTAPELARFALDCALVKNVHRVRINEYNTPERLLEAAARYGIDVEQVRAEITAAQLTPVDAARAPIEVEADAKKIDAPAARASVVAKAAPAKSKSKVASKAKSKVTSKRAKSLRAMAKVKVDAGVAGGAKVQSDLLGEHSA